jgi:hypothetical protein
VQRSLTGLLVFDLRKKVIVLTAMNNEDGCRKVPLNAGYTARMNVAVML